MKIKYFTGLFFTALLTIIMACSNSNNAESLAKLTALVEETQQNEKDYDGAQWSESLSNFEKIQQELNANWDKMSQDEQGQTTQLCDKYMELYTNHYPMGPAQGGMVIEPLVEGEDISDLFVVVEE